MCSQPPIDRDDSDLVAVNIEAIRLMSPAPKTLGIMLVIALLGMPFVLSYTADKRHQHKTE